jgi:hypothetical protein
MQLDPIPSDTRLSVQVVEEGDPDDTGPSADAHGSARRGHLLAPLGRCSLGAERGGVSAIIVREPLRRTKWWSRSASVRLSVTAAITL